MFCFPLTYQHNQFPQFVPLIATLSMHLYSIVQPRVHIQLIHKIINFLHIGVGTTGAAGAGAPPEILALSKISNEYVADTDSYYHVIQMAFCT